MLARCFGVPVVVIALGLPLVGCASKGEMGASDPEQRSVNWPNKAGGEAGGTLTIYGSSLGSQIKPFVRAGVLGDFSDKRSATLQNFGGNNASGTVSVSRSMTIPVMAGLSVPATSFGLNMPDLTAELFGGAQVTRRKSSLALTEALAPAATSGSSSWTSVDPAVGAALMYRVGNIGNNPVTVGPSVTVDWTRSHDLNVPSANFPATELYTLKSGNHTETTVLLNVAVGINSMMSASASGGAVW
jgi:hypothetical protein